MKSNRPQETIQHHTEFVVDLDFNLHQPSEVRLSKTWWFTGGGSKFKTTIVCSGVCLLQTQNLILTF